MGGVLSGIGLSTEAIYPDGFSASRDPSTAASSRRARKIREPIVPTDTSSAVAVSSYESAPRHQQQRIAISRRHPSKRACQLWRQSAVRVFDRLLAVLSQPFQRRQAAPFDATVIGDHMVGYT